MIKQFSRFLDWFTNFFSQRKGLIPLLGILLVVLNFVLQLVAAGWLVETNFFLHLGIILAILGFMIAWAL